MLLICWLFLICWIVVFFCGWKLRGIWDEAWSITKDRPADE